MTLPPLYGLVLAGGESLRMGEDKGAIAYHSKPQAAHLAELLGAFTQRVLISVRESQQNTEHLTGLETLPDHYASRSALNGIVSAMRAFPGKSFLVVAVDMPHVTTQAIEMLLSRRDGEAAATCFESPVKGGPDPLLAIWEGHAFGELEKMLINVQDHVCPRQALKTLRGRILRNAVPPDVLHNANTPAERDALQKRAS